MRAAAAVTAIGLIALSGCAELEERIALPTLPERAAEPALPEAAGADQVEAAVKPAAKLSVPPPDGVGPLDDPLTCLARTAYWEAKGEGVEGMTAVVHVVLNRARSKRFPSEICTVVTQGGPKGPCQFSWYCDGRGDTPREPAAYAVAHEVAWRALKGESKDPTRGATMFHNYTVRPVWATADRRTATIGNHTFYRLN